MNRNLSKRPKVVRKLDGALTAWRYFHGPNFVHEARYRRARTDRWYHRDSITREEGEALMRVLVRFVKWMQAPISPWAGSPFVEFVDETGTRRELRRSICMNAPLIPWDPRPTKEILEELRATVEKGRSDIARAMSPLTVDVPYPATWVEFAERFKR